MSTRTAGTFEKMIWGGALFNGRDSPVFWAVAIPRSASSRSSEIPLDLFEGSCSCSVARQAAALAGADGKLARVMLKSSR